MFRKMVIKDAVINVCRPLYIASGGVYTYRFFRRSHLWLVILYSMKNIFHKTRLSITLNKKTEILDQNQVFFWKEQSPCTTCCLLNAVFFFLNSMIDKS